jgi:hypothetical protein
MGLFRTRPTAGFDGNNPLDRSEGRNSPYSDRYTVPLGGGSNWALADEGSYFVFANPTLATGVAGHAAPVVADTDTKPFIHIYNQGGRVICPDFAQFEVTAAGTGGTLHYLVSYIDNKGATALSTGGTAVTPVSTRSDAPFATGAVVNYTPVLAMSSSKKVAQQIVREVIPVVQDTITVVWGSPNAAAKAALTTAGTATNHSIIYLPPVAVYPGGNFNLSFIRPSQSAAASYQFQFGYWER